MPLVNTRELLLDAQAHGYAVGAFNVENMEMMQAAIHAAEQEGAPIILQTTPTTVKYGGTALFASMARALAQASPAVSQFIWITATALSCVPARRGMAIPAL